MHFTRKQGDKDGIFCYGTAFHAKHQNFISSDSLFCGTYASSSYRLAIASTYVDEIEVQMYLIFNSPVSHHLITAVQFDKRRISTGLISI